MSGFSLSKAALGQHCLYSFRSDVVTPPELPTEESALGDACHASAAKMINSGCNDAPVDRDDTPTWNHMRAWILEKHKPSWVSEVAIAWHPENDTARVLGVNIEREYEKHGLLPGEVPGTLDLVSVENDVVHVYEFGTGWSVDHKVDQLRIQCVAAARAYSKDKVIGQLVQFREDGAKPWTPIVLDAFDLSAIAGEFAEMQSQISEASPNVSSACVDLFCDLRTECPETLNAQAALVPEGALTRKFTKVIEDADHARWLLERVRLVRSACDEIKAAIGAFVPTEGIELPDGKMLYEGAREMPRFNTHKALALLKQLGAKDAQVASLTVPVIESAGLKVGSKNAADNARSKRLRVSGEAA